MQRYTTLYTTLYNVIQDYMTLYKTIQHYTTLYYTIDDYYTRLYKTKQDYTTLYKTKRHYTTLYVISMFSFVVELHLLPRIKHKQAFYNIVRNNNKTLVYSFKRAENH